MTRPQGIGEAFVVSTESCEPSLSASQHDVDKHVRGNVRELSAVLACLRLEIDRSAAILRDLAGRLSQELLALGASAELGDLQPRLAAATIALQNEDRVQQRLCDMSAVLSLLERALADGDLASGPDLYQSVVDTLRLEETRNAFACELGLADIVSDLSSPAKPPSVGEIDLF